MGITLHLLASEETQKIIHCVFHESVRDRTSIQLHSSVGETSHFHTEAIVPLMIVFGYSEMSWRCRLFSVWIQAILMLRCL